VRQTPRPALAFAGDGGSIRSLFGGSGGGGGGGGAPRPLPPGPASAAGASLAFEPAVGPAAGLEAPELVAQADDRGGRAGAAQAALNAADLIGSNPAAAVSVTRMAPKPLAMRARPKML